MSTIKAGFFSIIIMAIIYCSLTIVGAQSRAVLGISPDGGSALYAIASHYFGKFGSILLGITITFACLKTTIGLVTSCSTTFSELFPNLFSYKVYAVLFSVFSFAISNVGLNNLIEYSLPALLFLYPLTIVLIVLYLLGNLFQYRRCVFVCTITATGIAAFLDLVRSLPELIQHIIPGHDYVISAAKMLPLSSISMGWVVPAVVGFCVGLIIKFALH